MANAQRVHRIVTLPKLEKDAEQWFACRNDDCGYSMFGQAIMGTEELELATFDAACPAPFADAVPFKSVHYEDYEVFFVRA